MNIYKSEAFFTEKQYKPFTLGVFVTHLTTVHSAGMVQNSLSPQNVY